MRYFFNNQINFLSSRILILNKNYWIYLIFLLLTPLAQAKLSIEITQGNDQPTVIGVAPFQWSGNFLLPDDVANIIRNDMILSGLFAAIPSQDMLSFPKKATDVVFSDWDKLGASYLVIGNIQPLSKMNNNGYQVNYQLFDVTTKKSILEGHFIGKKQQLREIAHYISDALYKKMTGIQGDFSSQLLYVTAKIIKPAKTIIENGHKKEIAPQYIYKLKYADSDGEQVHTILRSHEPIVSPAWSPDGRLVAYVSFEKKRSTIFIQNIATGKRQQIAAYPRLNTSPSWSPDGQYLAMTLSKSGAANIYIMKIANKKLSQITFSSALGSVINTEPAWMPDGRSLLFTSNRGGNPQIYQQQITFLKNDKIKPIYAPKRLTFEVKFNARVRVAPDGKWIAFVHKGKGETAFNIATMSLENSKMRVMTASEFNDSPSISPNGRRLIYSLDSAPYGELGIITIDSHAKYRLPSGDSNVREPAWGPINRIK